jgi:trehalose 6-phosphate phosphatase
MREAKALTAEGSRILARLSSADRILVALDYDGTIAPIVGVPEQARISPEMEDTLSAIADDPRYSLAIVSGRSLADLRGRLRIPATYAGNHGLEIEGEGISFVHDGAARARDAVDQASWDLEAALLGIRGARVERKGFTSTVHYRNAPVALEQWIRETVALTMRPYRELLASVNALEAVEVRPRVEWNKGSVVRLLLERLGASEPGLICAGDDRTDEDMFGVLPSEVSIRVGNEPTTRALYRAADVPELLSFLRALTAAGRASTARATERLSLTV